MENVSINDLKLEGLRATIDVDRDVETKQIHVFNVLNEDREEFIQTIAEYSEEGNETPEGIEGYYELLFERCVEGLDLDGSITEALANPTLEMMELNKVLEEMVTELQCQYQLNIYSQLLQTEMWKMIESTLSAASRIQEMQEELDNRSNEVVERRTAIENNYKIYMEELDKQLKISELLMVEAAKGTVEKAKELDKVLEENEKLGIEISK
ncbi:hypothetical protein [Metaclostridioides mangenotii]|uniref:hypothetical protein n=1 Tax=Metaclostridioides mangenotii TaxID=1540 RepID=UPI0004640A3C|nr:hypothetical protein [Clostridioides mangenotii]